MLDRMKRVFEIPGIDFAEARWEHFRVNKIHLRNREKMAYESENLSGNVRVLVNGNWVFVSFCGLNIGNIEDRVQGAIKTAKSLRNGYRKVARSNTAKEELRYSVKRGLENVSMTEKMQLLLEYNSILVDDLKERSDITYSDHIIERQYCNSEDTEITEETNQISLTIVAIAKEGIDVEESRDYIAVRDFACIEQLSRWTQEIGLRARKQLGAKGLKRDMYSVILDPSLASCVVHEAVGHMSEADEVLSKTTYRDLIAPNRKIGIEQLNVVDDGTIHELVSSCKYDDEGVRTDKTYIIKGGYVSSCLQSRETAAESNTKLTGNARALDCRFPPLVRMWTTYIEPNDWTIEEMIRSTQRGIYAKTKREGRLGSNARFTVWAQEGFLIQHGEIRERIKGVVISEDVLKCLSSIEAIASDLTFFSDPCGKYDQFPLICTRGSPHLKLETASVGT
jgi:TldD protein